LTSQISNGFSMLSITRWIFSLFFHESNLNITSLVKYRLSDSRKIYGIVLIKL
jgi:hypothetical protein